MQRLVVDQSVGPSIRPTTNRTSKGPVANGWAGPFACRPAPNDGGVTSECAGGVPTSGSGGAFAIGNAPAGAPKPAIGWLSRHDQ
jgi:hypothetical protein